MGIGDRHRLHHRGSAVALRTRRIFRALFAPLLSVAETVARPGAGKNAEFSATGRPADRNRNAGGNWSGLLIVPRLGKYERDYSVCLLTGTGPLPELAQVGGVPSGPIGTDPRDFNVTSMK
jgi:hypothetical protein